MGVLKIFSGKLFYKELIFFLLFFLKSVAAATAGIKKLTKYNVLNIRKKQNQITRINELNLYFYCGRLSQMFSSLKYRNLKEKNLFIYL